MGLSSAVLWWEVWQLRILVLGSLFIQYILFFSYWMRTARIQHRLRVLVWIAYIGGDPVAIYALATLFNRQTHICNGESRAVEVLWAPVLLVHLAGQPFISAYSLEDNELWNRHTVTLVSQVTVALYVFCKWWSEEKILLAASILLFVVGILKFAQKPWALRTASFNSRQASTNVPLPLHEYVYTLEEYVQAAKACVMDTKVGSHYEYETLSGHMFVDRSAPYSVRIEELPSFLKLEHKHAYNMLHYDLRCTFNTLYTRIESISTAYGTCLLLLLPFLVLASTVLFAMSRKDGHNEKDIKVTYILFSCTTVLEFLLPCMGFCAGCDTFLDKYTRGWHDMVSQYNLISFCVRKNKPTFLMKLATFNFLREFINQHWYIQHVPIAFQVTGVVRQHVKHGWKKYICDAASYRRFNSLRGQWALRKHHQLGWSLKKPFDESVLIWHIATDVCFYHPNTSLRHRQGEVTERSREISNYMIYLLLIRPEMLMPGTRSDLFTFASNIIVENSEGLLDTEEILAREILNMSMPPSMNDTVSDAIKLAKALMELSRKERWIVIQGVWVEMLCYSASRCRGYLHAKSLGDGGECLTTIWLFLSLMGMETLADRNHRSEPHEEQEEEVLPVPKEKKKGKKDAFPFRSQHRVSQSADNYSLV